jgi:hypothetical protein
MTSDPMTGEIRALREVLAAQFGNILKVVFADLCQREATDGHNYLSLPPRRPPQSLPAKSQLVTT